MKPVFGLVLTGGGARAAYQSGVLDGISEILGEYHQALPFKVLTGVSAGSINAAFLASHAHDFSLATQKAANLWIRLTHDSIMTTDAASLSVMAGNWIRNLSLGGFYKGPRISHVIDTDPLLNLLKTYINFKQIKHNLDSQILTAVAFTATNYQTGTAVTFYEGDLKIEDWSRSSRISKRTSLGLHHILASAAIPLLFKPVKIDPFYFGDGSIRLLTPLSPAIHLGADKILAIGIRKIKSSAYTQKLNLDKESGEITIADIAGELLNAIFMDTLEADIERVKRINNSIAMSADCKKVDVEEPSLRPIDLLVIEPSQDLSELAAQYYPKLPFMFRHLLRGIGASQERGQDLLSYLAFDTSYTKPLVELGRKDAYSHKDEIENFFIQRTS
jgi:NTE family protein